MNKQDMIFCLVVIVTLVLIACLCHFATAQCVGGACYRSPPPAFAPGPRPVAAPAPVPAQDSPAGFLALLNADRARYGRGPLGWDQNLANWAATNRGIHDPGSSGGASQCWAGCRSYVSAYYMWRGSPSHWAIMIGAQSRVGVAFCPSGMTGNFR